MAEATETLNPIKIEGILIVDGTGKYACAGINDVVTLISPEERVKLGLDESLSSAERNYELLKNYLERFFSKMELKINEIRVWSENHVTIVFKVKENTVINCDLLNFKRIN